METRHLGIKVTTLQPAWVATDGRSKAPTWHDDHDGYATLWQAASAGGADGVIQASEVAMVIADTIELPNPPLRIPVGAAAERLLAALHVAPTDQRFSITR